MFIRIIVLVLIIVCVLHPSVSMRHVSSYDITECQDSIPVYLLEGLYVHAKKFTSYFGKPCLKIEACINRSNLVPQELDLYQMLQNVSMLELHFVKWPSLNNFPDLPKLEELRLYDITPIGVWGACSGLKEIEIHDSINTTFMSPDWLINCTRLQKLEPQDMNVAEIRTVVDSTMGLQELQIFRIKDQRNSRIVNEPLFSSIRERHQWLKTVELYGDIERDESTGNNSIATEDSTWGEISAALVLQLSQLPRLEDVSITDKHIDFCDPGGHNSTTFKTLETLRLYETNTTRVCFKNLRVMPQLKRFDMIYSTDVKVQFGELFSGIVPNIEVTFSFSSEATITVASFDFVRDDYLRLSGNQIKGSPKGNVTFFGFRVRIVCDCDRTLWFARALREQLVTAPEVSCRDGRKPIDLPCEMLHCDRVSCESTCLCCRGKDGILADCRNTDVSTIPNELLELENLTRLLAPNNKISTLPDHLPDTLLFLDLAGNNIWQAGGRGVGALFSQPNRRIRLANNKIICSCENKLVIVTIQEKYYQVEDFHKLRCEISNQKIREVKTTELCEFVDRDAALLESQQIKFVGLTVALIIAAVTLVLGLLMYFQRRALQMFLFSHGWCLFCIQEKELDADRQYDIFLSFCHADTELVLKELLPKLDREFSVCIHLRDWCPGEMIPTHIASSVAQSRRTVVVLSRQFVLSLWGRLEFQTARMSGLMEGRLRVVMIVLDDVLERDEVEGDMRFYVRLNTYLKWGDPWFWEKLRFALPHHPSPRVLHEPSASLQPFNIALEQYLQMRQLQGPEDNANTTSEPIVVEP